MTGRDLTHHVVEIGRRGKLVALPRNVRRTFRG
jgi:hypothetical protein